jgi:hypothetical protein
VLLADGRAVRRECRLVTEDEARKLHGGMGDERLPRRADRDGRGGRAAPGDGLCECRVRLPFTV